MAEVRMQGLRASAVTFSSLLLTFFLISSCGAHVPLIIWTSKGSLLPVEPPVAGHILSWTQAHSHLSTALGSAPHTVLLFLQDKMSIDDFTAYGGVFGNKEESVFPSLEASLKEASSQLVLPEISWPVAEKIPSLLQEIVGTSPLYINPATLKEQNLPSADPALLVIGLPYSSGVQTKEVLRKNDEVIAEVLQVMKDRDLPFTAVYTGLKPSRMMENLPVDVESVGRTLLQAPAQDITTKAPVIFNGTQGPCIMLWAEQLNVSFLRNQQWSEWVDLGPLTFNNSVSLAGSVCNETVSRLVLNYANVLSFNSLSLTFDMSRKFFPVSARNWSTLDQLEILYDQQLATFIGRNIYSPAEYSYHCQRVSNTRDPLLFPWNTSDSSNQWRITFTDFQIQGFNVTGSFSYASDCASFFSPGIWMGLVTSLVLVLILTYGLHMIMQLRTMDRFDDPKGPSITVPQAE
ncbi:V-type proton ATPase subunit S1-like [Denticeps clupeoides]|uniref:Uncharacterized protein n=1 Tax=Denticeps clupeoides TaxID=299321 RepID=A0AAY4BZY8_9TELE|nr:V-type proton ATPase subunit S1-like [Denticeps clupeoides]